jgi:molybdate transport system substrate-binding protein
VLVYGRGHMHKYCIGIALLLLALGMSCGGSDADDPLDVYAAASLAEVLPEIASTARFSFAGSDELATQIREGAPADVYAAASSKYPQALFEDGLVEEPVTFASNRLVLIVPDRNPAAIESVEDILQRGTRLVVAAEGVPVGDYTRTVLENLGLSAALENVVSNEDDVKGVASKVALGEADAGFVYATDVTPVADRVLPLELPGEAQPSIEYQVAVIAGTDQRDVARAFVEMLRGEAGRTALEQAGFVVPT